MDERAPPIPTLPLSIEAFHAYGRVFGAPFAPSPEQPAYRHPLTEYWQAHVFDPGPQGATEVLWVRYRDASREVASLESHRLTEQAVVPLSGPVVQVVAASLPDGRPDFATLAAFRVPVGVGIAMRARCWHATRVEGAEVTCLMLTRPSTTRDLVAHLVADAPLRESEYFRFDARMLAG